MDEGMSNSPESVKIYVSLHLMVFELEHVCVCVILLFIEAVKSFVV